MAEKPEVIVTVDVVIEAMGKKLLEQDKRLVAVEGFLDRICDGGLHAIRSGELEEWRRLRGIKS